VAERAQKRSGAEDVQRLEPRAQHRPAIQTQPPVQCRRVDAAVVRVEPQRAVVQVAQARMGPDQAASELAPDQEHGGRCAVTRAAAAEARCSN